VCSLPHRVLLPLPSRRSADLLSPSVATRVLSRIATQSGSGKPAISDERLADVTQRERDVLSGVARGLSNQEIAAELYLSPATVRTYVSRLTTQLDARSRAELVVIAYENQLRWRSGG